MTLATIDPAIIERVLLHGDLRQLTTPQKLSYYHSVCESLGLNPLTQPFAYIVLNGKEVLYAKRDAAEQLRKVHEISIDIKARELIGEVYVVTACASNASGRRDESTGAVAVTGLKGDNLANAYLKAETKAKRRVTLSICGLGMLDETEVDSIPGARNNNQGYTVTAPTPAPALEAATVTDRGEVLEPETAHEVDMAADMPADSVKIQAVELRPTRNKNVNKYIVVLSNGHEVTTIKERLGALAQSVCQDGDWVTIETQDTKYGTDLLAIHRVKPDESTLEPITSDDIPF